MGCLLVIIMGAVTAALVYFFGFAEWVLILLGALWLASIVYSAVAGHWGFGGGGNTDLQIVIAGLGIAAAILVPSYQAHTPCGQTRAAMTELRNKESAFFAEHNSYTADLSKLGLTPASGVQVTIARANEKSYSATATHRQCLNEDGASTRVFREDVGNGNEQK